MAVVEILLMRSPRPRGGASPGAPMRAQSRRRPATLNVRFLDRLIGHPVADSGQTPAVRPIAYEWLRWVESGHPTLSGRSLAPGPELDARAKRESIDPRAGASPTSANMSDGWRLSPPSGPTGRARRFSSPPRTGPPMYVCPH